MGVQLNICQVFMSNVSNLFSDLYGSTARTISCKLQIAESRGGTQQVTTAPEETGLILLCLCLANIDHLSVTMRDSLRSPSTEQRHSATPADCTSLPVSSVAGTDSCQTISNKTMLL